jgi:hypothetical protein
MAGGTVSIVLSANDTVDHRYYATAGSTSKAYGGQWNYGGHLIG